MCEFCTQHGEGKKWYENMDNYTREVFSQVSSEEKLKKYLRGFRKRLSFWPFAAHWFKQRLPSVYDSLVYPRVTSSLKKHHFGQVVPLEDAEKILENVGTIVQFPCICRKVTSRREVGYCLGVGMDMTEIVKDVPDFSNFEVLSPQKAISLVRELEGKGMMHSVWTFETPFIGGMCNCDRDCMAYNVQLKMNIGKAMWRAEYVAEIDLESCNGCRRCLKNCLFEAVEYDSRNKKCSIDLSKCYGCGICRTFCHKNAITLRDRLNTLGDNIVW